MTVEVLYPEICNLSGDSMNIRYLHQCCPQLEIVQTALGERPAFTQREVSLVYLGSATEKGLELIVSSLTPYRGALSERIEKGGLVLVTGNALDALGKYVKSDDGWHLDGLGLIETHAEYEMMNRHNSFFLGRFEDMEIMGFKSLFGHTYGADDAFEPFITVTKGIGRFPGASVEGFRRGGLMATYLTGPLLVLNPPFTKWLLRQIGAPDALAYEEAAFDAYKKRLSEFAEPDRDYHY